VQHRRVRAGVAVFGDEMRRLTAALVLFATPAAATEAIKYPVPIPQECFELARREGVPTMIESKFQAIKARVKLARLSGKEPMVRDCRAAVNRARQAYETANQQHTPAAHPPEAAMRPVGMMGNSDVRTSDR
jgi:hypothetical protein